jgi:hypothetical protein
LALDGDVLTLKQLPLCPYENSLLLPFSRRERERESEKVGVVSDTTVEGGSETIIFDLKVPRHCPLVLLIRARLEFRAN